MRRDVNAEGLPPAAPPPGDVYHVQVVATATSGGDAAGRDVLGRVVISRVGGQHGIPGARPVIIYMTTHPAYPLLVQDLLRVVGIWMDGDSTLDESLWGMSMLWWGRLGKITAYVAALVVILDLIGAARVRNVANRVGNVYAKLKLWTSSSKDRVRARTDDHRNFEDGFAASALVLLLLATSLLAPMTSGSRVFFIPILATLAIYLWRYMLVYAIGMLIVALLLPFAVVTVTLLDLGKFLTWLGYKALGGDGYGHPLRVGAIFVGLLGFLMDILAT